MQKTLQQYKSKRTDNMQNSELITGLNSDLLVRFMTEQPFFWGVYSQLRTKWVSGDSFPFIAGVYHSKKGFVLQLNKDKWADLDDDSKIFVLAHECAHVALGHIPPDEQVTKLNKMLVNISMDLVINEHFQCYRKSAIAKTGMWLSSFPQLPQNIKDLDWRTIYQILMDSAEKPEEAAGFDEHGSPDSGDEGDDKEQGSFSNQMLSDLAKARSEEIARSAARSCQIRGKESNIPQQIKILIERPLKPYIQVVRELLQRFIMSSRDTKKRLTWRRVSRRLGAISRGRLSARLPRVAVAVDSSGSMVGDPATIDLISQAISAVCAVADSVECVVGDTEVRASGTITASNIGTVLPEIMRGGGGTVLQPLLEFLAESGRYDAVILITDGMHENLDPPQPTAALIVPGGVDSPGIGRSVHLVSK